MENAKQLVPDGQLLLGELRAYIDRAVINNGGSTKANRPSHRVKFHWPPHPISYEFHVLASDWTSEASFEAHGEVFPVRVARTHFGVFGRCEELWHEDRGDTEEEMLQNLRNSSEPLFQRQFQIAKTLELTERFRGHVRELPSVDLLKLLYCTNRDVANDSKMIIETLPGRRRLLPSLLEILNDDRHPDRRSAQWCVLDLFEDLPSFTANEEDEANAIEAMKNLIWRAEDDYARTIYKAGVVLGGHIPYLHGGPTLIECLDAPSKVGKRSAIHGLFHVVEWMPDMKDQVLAGLEAMILREKDPQIRQFAKEMSEDIRAGSEHRPEPVFDFER